METRRETLTDGDVKRTHPGGRVEYFYREVDTWHTTHPGGVEVYHFPSGQTEARKRSAQALVQSHAFCVYFHPISIHHLRGD